MANETNPIHVVKFNRNTGQVVISVDASIIKVWDEFHNLVNCEGTANLQAQWVTLGNLLGKYLQIEAAPIIVTEGTDPPPRRPPPPG